RALGGALQGQGRSARDTRRTTLATVLARRAPTAVECPSRRDEPRWATSGASGRSRDVRRERAPAPRGQTGHHWAVAGHRTERSLVRGLREARPHVRAELGTTPGRLHH